MILLLLLPYYTSFLVDHFYLNYDGVTLVAQVIVGHHVTTLEVG